MKNILIYGIAGWEPEKEARVVINAVRNLGYRSIFVCDKENETMKLADRPVINSDWNYDFLKKIAVEEKIDLAILIVDFASPLVGRLNRELSLPGPTDVQYAAVSDKLEWSKLARKCNLKMPEELLATEASDFKKWTSDKPIIVKPTKSTGNVSNEKFGYQYYSSVETFQKELEAKGELKRFCDLNKRGSIFGKYLIQERLDYRLWGNLGLTFVDGVLTINEMHDRFFYPYPHQTYQIGSIGPVNMSEKQQAHARKVCEILQENVGFKNTGLNIDIIETPEGELYTVDINVRFGSTWSTFLPLRKIAYFEEVIQGFLGLPFHLPETKGYYLRHKVNIAPGILESVQWPKSLDPRVKLEGIEHCKPGLVVGSTTGRHNWPVETLITAETKEECWQLYNNLIEETKVTYLAPA